MDSMMDDDPTLPIDFDQTSNFARFLNQSRKDSMQSDVTMSEYKLADTEDQKKELNKKQRSLSTNDQPPERPLSRGGTMREQDNLVGDLKKECFGLKMRIYFMEDQLRIAYNGDTDGTIKKNIELKVTIEEIKHDLTEKSNFLTQASEALHHMSLEKENDIKELEEKHQNEQQKVKDDFNSQLRHKDEEILRLQRELENYKINVIMDDVDAGPKHSSASVAAKEQEIEKLKKKLAENNHRYKDLEVKKKSDEEALKSLINELEEAVALKEANIQSLKRNVEKLAHSPERSNQHYRKLYEGQSKEINEKDQRINSLVKDLSSKTNLAEGLKEHIVNMEKSIKGMRSNLHEKEMDKQRIVNQLQEKIKHYQNQFEEKEKELAEKSESVGSLKDNMKKLSQQRLQFQLDSAKEKDSRLVELDIMIKQQSFEVEKLKALLEEKDKEIVYFGKRNVEIEEKWRNHQTSSAESLQALKKDFGNKLLSQKRNSEELLEKYHVLEDNYKYQIKRKDKTIQSFADAMKHKDGIIKNLVEITQKDSGDSEDDVSGKDNLIERLQLSLRNTEKQMEDTKEEYFGEVQRKDEQLIEMKKSIRDKSTSFNKSQEQIESLKLKIESLQRSLKDHKDVTEKLKNSLERSMHNEGESQLRSANLLHQKEQDIQKLTSLLKVKNKQLESLEKLSQDLLAKIPEDTDNDELTEMLKSLSKPYNNGQAATNWNEVIATEIKNQELLSMLKAKENDVKELYEMLRDQQNEKEEAFEAVNEKLLNTEQEVKELSSALLALKDVQQTESKNVEETIASKEKGIEDLIKSGKEKDRLLLDLKENSKILRSSSPTKSTEVNKLRDQLDELRTKLHAKLDEKEDLKKEIESLNLKLSDATNKGSGNENTLRKQIEDLEDICHTMEDEKIQLQAELGLAKLSNESLENQLEGAHTRISRQGTPDYKESLMEELENLVKAAEKEKARYQTLAEKLQNNQHPESCFKLLKNEITEIEHLRRNLQGILLNVLKKQPEVNAHQQHLANENKQLKARLQQQSQMPDMAAVKRETETDNQSLKNDLKRCEIEVKQLNDQIDSMRNEYEQLVHERDREITHVTAKLDELNKDKDILVKQRDQTKEDLIACHKQLDLLKVRVEEQGKKVPEESIASDKESMLNNLQLDNNSLKRKLAGTESDLKHLNETLQRMREVDVSSLETRQNSVLEEKKQLKKDAKELCNINDRLRSKLKDLTKSYEVMKRDKDTEQSRLLEEIQKARAAIGQIEEDMRKRQRQFDHDKDTLVQRMEEKTNLCNEAQLKYEATLEENTTLHRKVEELVKVNECQQTLTAPELQQLRDEVLTLTKENSQLKIEKLQHDGTRKETTVLSSALEESKHRNKALQEELYTQVTNHRQLQNKMGELEVGAKSRDNHAVHVGRLESDLKDLKKLKELLERQLKEFSNSARDMKEQINISRVEISTKDKKITSLKSKISELTSQVDSFAPLQTSSQQNISLSAEACTQTRLSSSASDEDKSHWLNDSNSLIAMHIQEMRELRKQLEETRKNNDALRQQLEDRLLHVEREAKMLNDPELKATLIRDNDAMRVRLSESEASQQRMKITIEDLTTEKQSDQNTIQQLHLQLHELNQMSTNLKLEMEAYDRLVKQFGISRQTTQEGMGSKEDSEKLDKHLLKALLEEIRDLREQLTKSIDVNIALRDKLEQELGRPVSISPLVTPSKDPTMSAKRSLFSAVLQSVSINDGGGGGTAEEGGEGRKARVHFGSPFETPTKDYSVSLNSSDGSNRSSSSTSSSHRHHNHRHDACVLFGTWNDYRSILDGIKEVMTSLHTSHKRLVNEKQSNKTSTAMQYCMRDLSSNSKKLKELNRLVHSFIPQDDKQNNLTEENVRLRKDIGRLKKVLVSKEHFIQSALKMVEENALWKGKKDEDLSITKKLLKARDTLKTTKGNLEMKAKKAQQETSASMDASFVSSSSSFEEPKSPTG